VDHVRIARRAAYAAARGQEAPDDRYLVSRADRFHWYWRISNRLEAFFLRWLGTSGSKLVRRSVLLLETTGRRTGKRRRAPVVYWKEGDSFFVGGGAAGMSRVDWVANLNANPNAAVLVGRKRMPVVATRLKDKAYERARDYAFERWPYAVKYVRKSGRPIPYFRLDPTGEAPER
jgi:deazaflavin-dependent oxidoreductase (nitroreductase family)